MCVFLSDRVELCLAGRWVSRLMIIQEGGIYLVVESQFSLDKKTGFPEEEKVVWGFQGTDMGLEFSRRRKGQTFFFPLHSLVFDTQNFFFFFKPGTDDTQQTI